MAELRRGRPGPQHVEVRVAGSSSPALATAWPAKPTTRFLRLWEVEIENVPS